MGEFGRVWLMVLFFVCMHYSWVGWVGFRGIDGGLRNLYIMLLCTHLMVSFGCVSGRWWWW